MASSELSITAAVIEDFDAVCEVLREGDEEQRATLPDVFCEKVGPVRPRDFLEARIRGPESAILLARKGALVVGVLEVVLEDPPNRDGWVSRRTALVDNVVVRRTHRGCGIGTRLLAEGAAWAKARRADAVRLHVWTTNPSAQRLYERLGYAPRIVTMERAL